MTKEAVVIIDVQNAILGHAETARQEENHRALEGVVAKIEELIAHAREADVPVLFVQHDGAPGHRLEVASHGWGIRPEIAPIAGEPVIHKTVCDSFFETTLWAELESRQIEKLIVAGCMTQYCVDTTVRRAVSLGYDVILVADAHMTKDSGALGFEQIIGHHNLLLEGFDAGAHCVSVLPSTQIFKS